MTGELSIDYEALAQDAMRGIVRAALEQVAGWGYLPGEHHFYIAFDTRAPGVVLSKRLKQRYPEEMTIVLQHQFHNLDVDDERFEVTLSFDGISERLAVPLRAIRVFFDPSVPYGLQFDSSDLVAKAGAEAASSQAGGITPDIGAADGGDAELPKPSRRAGRDIAAEATAPPKPRPQRKPRATPGEGARQLPADLPAPTEAAAEPMGTQLPRTPGGRPMPVQPKPDEPANDSKVVQLDQFRKR